MARIETYPLDGNISVNDYVIGTDGDSLNATKNYKVLTFLDYLGRLYNLNSTDLLFNYNAVDSVSVGNGEISTNNFADGTILMSGVTNIYVSKLSAFGQLIDDIINTTGTENLSIMFTDMGNRNNLGIFTVNSTVDVNANTINMSVTGTTAVGSISSGKVMGIRIGVGGNEVDLSNYVTLDTQQTITAEKTFTSRVTANTIVFSETTSTPLGLGIGTFLDRLLFRDKPLNQPFLFNGDNLSGIRTYTLPNKDGTLALLDDISAPDLSNYVTLNTSQTITASKTFGAGINVTPSIVFTPNGTFPSVLRWSSTTGDLLAFSASEDFLWMQNGKLTWMKQGQINQGVKIDNSNTAVRDYLLPDKNGTFAMISDIPSLSEYVTTNTIQTISARKTFTQGLVTNDTIISDKFGNNISMLQPVSETYTTFEGYFHISSAPSNNLRFHWNDGGGALSAKFNFNNITVDRTFEFPNKSGIVAMTSDIPSLSQYVTTNTAQNITASKTFTAYQFFNAGFNAASPIVLSGTSNGIFMANANAGLNTDTNNGIWFDSNDNFTFRSKGDTFSNTLASLVNTSNRTHTLPDKSGTVAHTTDIPTATTGTFTPTLTPSISGSYNTSGGATGSWVKYGVVVYFSILFNAPTSSSPSGTLIVGGLPWDFAGALVNASVTMSSVTSPSNPRDLNVKGTGVTGQLHILYNDGFDNTTPMSDVTFGGSGQVTIVGSFTDLT